MKIVNVIDSLPKHNYKKYPKRSIQSISHIVVHHSLTDDLPGDSDIKAFARYHVEHNGWPGIGYHYVIDKDGTVYKTNPASIKVYHVGNHNSYSLGICLVGDFRDYQPTDEQYNALIELIQEIKTAYNIKNIVGHSELDGYEWKKCPCIDMDKLRRDIIEMD